MNKLKAMKNIILFLFIGSGTFLNAQKIAIGHHNFIAPLYQEFQSISSKVKLEDTSEVLKIGLNQSWDFSNFGGYQEKDSISPIWTYSFLPREEGWLIDSANNRVGWTNPKVDFILRNDGNFTYPNINGKTVDGFEEWYFSKTDTLIKYVGSGLSIWDDIGFSMLTFLPFDLPLKIGKSEITRNDSTNVDYNTFWWKTKNVHGWLVSAEGSIELPFGKVNNCLRIDRYEYKIDIKTFKSSGNISIDTLAYFQSRFYAPELCNGIPIVDLEYSYQKPEAKKHRFYNVFSRITDQQSLTILENWNTPIENWFYPNPATNEITLIGFENATSFKIYGLNGQKIKQGLLNQNVINTESLSPNFYILEVFDGETAFKSKLVIQ